MKRWQTCYSVVALALSLVAGLACRSTCAAIVTNGDLTASSGVPYNGTDNPWATDNLIVGNSAPGSMTIDAGYVVQNNGIGIIANSTAASSPGSGLSEGIGAALVPNRAYVDLALGINETVNILLLNGVAQGPGTYGSSISSATFKNDNFFAGSGMITVLIPEPTTARLLLLGLASLAARRRRRSQNG